MKNLSIFIFGLMAYSGSLHSQSQLYSVPVVAADLYIRDSSRVIGQLDLDFPEDGLVFIQFDGVGYGSPGDRIILAANHYPDWDTNDGNVSFISDTTGEGHCFSHTRSFPVSAGPNSFYAVAHNYVDINGTGIATIYGTFYVEYIPQSSEIIAVNSITIDEFDAMLPTAYDSVNINVAEPGTVELRLNGNLDCNQGDIIVVGATATKNWNFSDPFSIPLETNNTYSPYVPFSSTRIYDNPVPGSHTYYAMAQRGFEEEGNGFMYAYTNLHARFYPQSSDHILNNKLISGDNLSLDEDLVLLDSIELDVTKAGKVEIRFDGALQSESGKQILLAASDHAGYTLQDGSVILTSPDEDLDRHPFVHTRVYNIEPGSHTFYVMAQHYQGIGQTNIDLHGHFLVKYYPENTVHTEDISTGLSFDMLPNPANSHIIIQSEEMPHDVTVSVLDLDGRRVHYIEIITPGKPIDISALPSGMYIVRVSNGNKMGVQKLVRM